MSASTVPQLATRREWIGLAILALPTLLLSLDISVLYLALPILSSDLHASSNEQLWILDIYSFLLAGFLVTMGTLGDRIGRRKLLLIGGAAFGVASIVAAYSTSAEMLIVSRALLGVAGATLMPSTMALIRNMFHDPKQMGQAIGVWFSCFMGGMLLGPLVGGILLEHFWWGSAFLLGVPFMVLLLIVGPILLPEYRDANAGKLDLASVALSLLAILPVIYGVKSVTRSGLDLIAGASIVAGLAFGVAFVLRQRKLEHPLLDLKLFTNRKFSTALSTMWFGGVIMAGVSLVAAMYLQLVLGYDPLTAGLLILPQNVVMLIGYQLAPRLAAKFGNPRLITGGLLICGIGFVIMTFIQPGSSLALLLVGMCVAALGMSFPMALTANIILGSAPPEKAGSAAAVMETSGEFGIAVGIAALGSLAAVVYRGQIADAVPADLPADAAAAVHEGIATATAYAGQLGPEVVRAVNASFTTGMNAVTAVGAAIFIALAVLCAVVLRKSDESAPSEPSTTSTTDEAVPVAAGATER